MMTGYGNKMLQLNVSMKGHKAGKQISVAVDKDGVPIERYWRDRVKESQKDGCVEWVPEEIKKAKKGE